MEIMKTDDGKLICPSCGQHEISIELSDTKYVYHHFWDRIRQFLQYDFKERSVGIFNYKTYICPKCNFKVTEKEFMAWIRR